MGISNITVSLSEKILLYLLTLLFYLMCGHFFFSQIFDVYLKECIFLPWVSDIYIYL